MTIELFCGKISDASRRHFASHEAVMGSRQAPAMRPFLDIFPSILQLAPSWVPGCDFDRQGAVYYRDNLALWRQLQNDVCVQMVSHITPVMID
jgi:hypothetical protein